MRDRSIAEVVAAAVVSVGAFCAGVYYERSQRAAPPQETSIDEDCKDSVHQRMLSSTFSCPHPLHALIVGEDNIYICRCQENAR